MNTLVVVTGAWCAAAVIVGIAVGGWLGACHRSLDSSDDWVLWECELASTKPDEPATPRYR
jgi:hypothetical protein